MPSLASAAVVAALAFVVPLLLRLARLPLPGPAALIVAGWVVGPQLLGWATRDQPVAVLAVVGLAFLLLLAGLELDLQSLRGRLLAVAGGAFALSFALAAAVGAVLAGAGLVRSPLLVAVTLSATSLGILLPVLEDAGQLATPTGRAVAAGASLAEVVPVVLLSVLFAGDGGGLVPRLTLLATFLVLVAVLATVLLGVVRTRVLTGSLLALQESTAEIRVRGTVALLLVLAALATRFGLEAILGAYLAGVTLKLADRDEQMTHSLLPVKLRAVGFGVFVPVFFVATGLSLDVRGLVGDAGTLAKVPVFLVALLLVRGVPALLYRRLGLGLRQVLAAGLLQATSLSIPVVAGAIGVALGLVRPTTATALVAAGLVSVLVFPLVAVRLLPPASSPS